MEDGGYVHEKFSRGIPTELRRNDFDEDEKRTTSQQTPLYSFISGNRRSSDVGRKRDEEEIDFDWAAWKLFDAFSFLPRINSGQSS